MENKLGNLVSFISKGIAPKYADESDQHVIRVLNQKCNRNFEINFENARYNNLDKKKVPEERILKENDILINSTGTGTAGRIAQIRKEQLNVPTTVDGHMIILRAKNIDPKFLGYSLKAKLRQLESYAEGSTGQTEINRERLLNETIINYPDNIEEQKKIVRQIECVDELIRLNKQINDNLLELANTLFKHYFPDINTGTDKIGDYIKNFDKLRKPLSKKQRSEMPGKYRYIGATSVNDHIDKYNFDGIYLLLGEDGTVQDEYGFPILQYTFGKFWPNNHAHVLQGKNVSTEWLYLYFSQRNISGIVTGAVQKKVSQKNMNSLKFKLPDSQELKKFDKIIQPLFSKIRSTKLENYQLEELKRVLLTKLF